MSVAKRLIEKDLEAGGELQLDHGTLERDGLRIQLYYGPSGERRLMIMFDEDNYSFLSPRETTKLVHLILHTVKAEAATNIPVGHSTLRAVVDGTKQ